MTNPFDLYADEKGYRGLPKKFEKIAKGPSELDVKMAEKGRLQANYKRLQRQHAKAMFALEPRLKAFRRYLKSVTADDGDELIDAVRRSWIPSSPVDVRRFAMDLASARVERIRLVLGLDPLGEELPHELGGPVTQGVWRQLHGIIYPGGRG